MLKSQKMRILYYDPTPGEGGAAKILKELASNLDRSYFKPLVVTLANEQFFSELRKIDIEVIRLPFSKMLLKMNLLVHSNVLYTLLYVIPQSLMLLLLIKRKKITIVHTNSNIVRAFPAILAAKLARIPCICHIHEIRKPYKSEIFFSKWVQKFLVVTKKAKEVYSDYLDENKIVIIYNGIDLTQNVARRACDEIKKDFNIDKTNVVGLIGRIVEGKGHIDFIKAAQIVVTEIKDVMFLIVGSASNEDKALENELRKLTRDLNLEKNIKFTGWVNCVPDIVSVLDILVQASSTYAEGSSFTYFEAMVQGKPVIATDIPGSSEIIINGENGIIVRPADYEGLAAAIMRLIKQPDLARKMGTIGQKKCKDRFDLRKVIESVESIYKGVV